MFEQINQTSMTQGKNSLRDLGRNPLFTLAREGSQEKHSVSAIQAEHTKNNAQSFIGVSMSPVIPNNSQDQMNPDKFLMQIDKSQNS